MNKTYYKAMKNKKASTLLVEAVKYIPKYALVLELGAGPMNDTKYLVEKGYIVYAVDKSPLMVQIAKKIKTSSIGTFFYKKTPFEKFEFPPNFFDLISAQWCLYFIEKKKFAPIFSKIKKSLKKGGIFTGHILGDEDDWKNNMTTLPINEAKKLFKGMEIIKWKIEKKTIVGVEGKKKHWHVYWIIAKKR